MMTTRTNEAMDREPEQPQMDPMEGIAHRIEKMVAAAIERRLGGTVEGPMAARGTYPMPGPAYPTAAPHTPSVADLVNDTLKGVDMQRERLAALKQQRYQSYETLKKYSPTSEEYYQVLGDLIATTVDYCMTARDLTERLMHG